MRAGLVSMLLLAGCLEAHLVPCEDGRACPPGTVCDEVHATCISPEEATACAALPELAPCLTGGVCHDGICVPARCGNGHLDPPEVCDDGNTASADGCSADCASTELCGNGVVDPVVGEVCDGGDLVSHDGCDSRCLFEQPAWTRLVQVPHPTREYAAYAYDHARRRLVVFGGEVNGTRLGNTLEWDGAQRTWLDRTPTTSPTARYCAGMAYDAARHVSVLFGGSELSGAVADTWLWDGERWTLPSTVTAPARRTCPAMTYDARRRRVILFGGRDSTSYLADTWTWDGTAWTQLVTATSPPPRERSLLAYDPVRDRVVLVGGVGASGTYSDMWLLDGAKWTQVTPTSSPPRFGGTLTFDPVRGGLVLAGGGTSNPTQLWDGTAWQVIGAASGGPMTSRYGSIAYFDPDRGTTVAGLGYFPPSTYLADMHELVGDTWTSLAAELGPANRNGAMMAYDARRGRLVLFGGNDGVSDLDDLWELAGTTWVPRVVTPRPPARDHGAMAYDAQRGKVVLWGGHATDSAVWEWDGTSWTSIVPAGPAPAARWYHAMAYDAAAGVTVMFGGGDATPKYADTWTWDGSAWRDVTSASAPAARNLHPMAYDARRGEVVLFGGLLAGGARPADTWTWSSDVGWAQRSPGTSPSGRARHAMTADPIRGEVAIFGGSLSGIPVAETWTWNGATWARVLVETSPPAQVDAAFAYDNARAQMIAVGTEGTWRLQWQGSTPDDACAQAVDRDGDGLAGCADPDCWASCAPLCPIGTSCGAPSCGDGTCAPIETCRLCPADCGACPVRCGDGVCDAGELCPGDCL